MYDYCNDHPSEIADYVWIGTEGLGARYAVMLPRAARAVPYFAKSKKNIKADALSEECISRGV